MGSDATDGILGGSKWRLAWLRRRSQLLTGCSWCRRLVLLVRRKRSVTYDRDGGNLSTIIGLSLLTVVGAGTRDWWAASIETIVMLLELKMTLLVHADDG
ncbi:hypothetical protein NC653_039512 [Populus alba x Populus x berolinensis]|uniref:Uncharacterized protein n=1 Tax=Populus alba x Populus x berolinensis TaxID=444605 RepID=A0AAD6LCY1_9ROSI|nr:hypothetical protein NC653_039512 [Populus alba x Populus x berolinensis]